jgi:hypothetical protein
MKKVNLLSKRITINYGRFCDSSRKSFAAALHNNKHQHDDDAKKEDGMEKKNIYRNEIQFSICLNFRPTFSSALLTLTSYMYVDNLFFMFTYNSTASILHLFSTLFFYIHSVLVWKYKKNCRFITILNFQSYRLVNQSFIFSLLFNSLGLIVNQIEHYREQMKSCWLNTFFLFSQHTQWKISIFVHAFEYEIQIEMQLLKCQM